MRPMHILAFSALCAVPFFNGCSSKPCSGFGNNCEDSDGGAQLNDAGEELDDAGNPIPTGDAGCPFCGVDGSTSDSGGGGCNPNPANFDVPGNNCDDDGDGIVDNPQGACDTGLPANPSAAQFAKAIGLCPNTGDTWGVTSATFTQGYNSTKTPAAKQAGALAKFGTNVNARQGSALGIISSGLAAANDCAGGNFNGSYNCAGTAAGTAPPGYPKTVSGCDIASNVNNVINANIQIKVPANAKGFSFDFNFYSGEWPDFVCTTFNDSFVAWLTSTAWAGKGGDYNISFDSNNNPINVNNGFFQACYPAGTDCSNMQTAATCTLGETQLIGTGFDQKSDYCGNGNSTGGGATGWLTTQAPVTPGETITIQFMVWNTGDDAYDSLALLDNWQWVATDTTVQTGRPPN
jgi:hypothetical protein